MTVVAHGFIARDGTLCLWTETDTGERGSARAHPFAVAPAGADRTATLLLPSCSTARVNRSVSWPSRVSRSSSRLAARLIWVYRQVR